jgi:hypothetical protein
MTNRNSRFGSKVWNREESEKRTILFLIRVDDAVMDAVQPWGR